MIKAPVPQLRQPVKKTSVQSHSPVHNLLVDKSILRGLIVYQSDAASWLIGAEIPTIDHHRKGKALRADQRKIYEKPGQTVRKLLHPVPVPSCRQSNIPLGKTNQEIKHFFTPRLALDGPEYTQSL